MDALVFFSFSEGTLGLDAWLVSCAFACLSVVWCSWKNQMIIFFLRAEKNSEGEKKTNRDVNQVDEEHNRRASIFLPINRLKINTSRFDSLATRRGEDIVWLLLVSLVVSIC